MSIIHQSQSVTFDNYTRRKKSPESIHALGRSRMRCHCLVSSGLDVVPLPVDDTASILDVPLDFDSLIANNIKLCITIHVAMQCNACIESTLFLKSTPSIYSLSPWSEPMKVPHIIVDSPLVVGTAGVCVVVYGLSLLHPSILSWFSWPSWRLSLLL